MSPNTISSVTWNFGDCNHLIGNTNVSHCYNATGVLTITANANMLNGCKNATSTIMVQVYPKPSAAFNYSISTNGLVNFFDASSNPSIISWNWCFNATANTSNEQNPSYTCVDTTVNYNVCMVVNSEKGCKDTICKTVFFNTAIGINENSTDNKFKIFPNPVTDILTIEITHSGILEVYDVIGTIVYRQSINPGNNTIDLQQLSGGINLIRIKKITVIFSAEKQ